MTITGLNLIWYGMVLDLDYDMVDFLVKDKTKVDAIRKLVEDIIQNSLIK